MPMPIQKNNFPKYQGSRVTIFLAPCSPPLARALGELCHSFLYNERDNLCPHGPYKYKICGEIEYEDNLTLSADKTFPHTGYMQITSLSNNLFVLLFYCFALLTHLHP